jgi:hypothetical protein
MEPYDGAGTQGAPAQVVAELNDFHLGPLGTSSDSRAKIFQLGPLEH